MRLAGALAGTAIGTLVASVAFVASPIDRAKASLCRRRAENGSPALDLLKRCTDVFDELAEFGVTVRGGDAQLERSVFDRRQRKKQQRYVGIVQRVERAVETRASHRPPRTASGPPAAAKCRNSRS